MKVVQINTSCGVGSTGKICVGISQALEEQGIENCILYSALSNGYENGISCSNGKYVKLQALKSRVLGNYGFNSRMATRKMIAELERIQPDIVHLHNIHGHDCNLEMLFTYFKKKKTKLVWTFHDCWAFTGYCTYFTMTKCSQWKQQCEKCLQRKDYSCFFDKSQKLFAQKKQLFKGLDLTIVTPSQWLADLVKESFLKDYPVYVINNGIDLAVFRPRNSVFRRRYDLEDKKLVLGVSFLWDKRKGTDVFSSLAQRLPADYQIVLVGTDGQVDRQLPDNIISIHRTQNQQELAEIYSTADVFINPTREENYPTVNMESLACGTPVLTFRTGGSPEILDTTCGSVVDCDDIDAMEKEIIRICTDKPYSKEACVQRAKAFDKNERFKEYVELYERINVAGTERN
ncbi:MAG: glycosyltransferase [Ruminococcaceae bacterium]|nr:glycosyltransferase [Oscillospiraceae bacterium]